MKPDSAHHDDIAPLLPDFEILAELGRGGISAVYLARERELNREVAIKVIRNQFLGDEEARVRVDREARTLAQLRHSNIITLLGARRLADGRLALVMQYTNGQTLRSAIEQAGPFPYAAALLIARQVAAALGYVHSRGYVHRDVKPENIFVEEDGHVLLSDLGIAKATDALTSVTLTGVIVGTPTYMSPEQIDGGHLDGRSDLYSLGLVLYELLTGKRPWDGESLFSVILKQKTASLPPLAELCPDVPVHFRDAIERALAKQPEERWATAEEFLEQIEGHAIHAVAAYPAPGEVAPVSPTEPIATPVALATPVPQGVHGDVPDAGPEPEPAPRPQKKRLRRRTAALVAVLVLVGGGVTALSTSARMQQGFAPGASSLFSAPAPPKAASEPQPTPEPQLPLADQPREVGYAAYALASEPPQPEPQPSRAEIAKMRAEEERAAAEAKRTAELALLRSARGPEAAAVVNRQSEPTAGMQTMTVVKPMPRLTSPELLNLSAVRGQISAMYPAALVASRTGGTVTLGLLIDQEGKVGEVTLVSSSGHTELDDLALRVAGRMRFSPALQNGVPVSKMVQMPLVIQP